jgi:small subunit ribosomal protein S13
LDKEEKENKEMPEDPVEETAGEEKIQDKAEEAVEEPTDEPKEKPEVQAEEKTEGKVKEPKIKKEQPEKTEEPVEGTKEEIEKPAEELKEAEVEKTPEKIVAREPAEKQTKTKTEKPKGKKEDKKKEEEHDDDFRYIVRIANTDINGEKKLIHGLTSIKGVGHHMGVLVANETGINRNVKFGDLTDAQIEKIKKTLDSILDIAPGWMLNHRKDYETGEDLHLIGPEIDMRLRDKINIMKKIRSYRGIRHERGLPARGQRTRANNRRGLALGVSKKRP